MPDYKSSPSRLVRLFHRGRERWKKRALDKQHQVRALEVTVRDLRASRDQWKERARQAEAKLRALSASVSSSPQKKMP